MVHMSTLDGAK